MKMQTPGHYMLIPMGADIRAPQFARVLEEPNLQGVQIRYTWRDLAMDFSAIDRDLDYLEPLGKKLVIQFQDKSFKPGDIFVPLNMVKYTVTNKSGGLTLKKWLEPVQAEISRLMHALGRELDTHPTLEAITLTETAGGINKVAAPDFTAAAYRQGLETIAIVTRFCFAQTPVIQYINGLDYGISKMPEFCSRLVSFGVGLGGPDLVPGSKWHEDHSYPEIRNYGAMVQTGVAVQHPDYDFTKPSGGKNTCQIIADYGINNLELDYIFWLKREPFFTEQVLPIIRAST